MTKLSLGLAFGAALFMTTAGSEAAEAEADLNIVIQESKVLFISRVQEYDLKVRGSHVGDLGLPCRSRSFFLLGGGSLYKGWNPAKARENDDETGKMHEYIISTCRNRDIEGLLWFEKPRDIEHNVPEQLAYEDFEPSKNNLLVQIRSIKDSKKSFYRCGQKVKKELLKAGEKSNTYRLTAKCEAAEVTEKLRGPVDFVNNPGAFAAKASYRGWMLPSVASDSASFEKASKNLLTHVPSGKYSGVMKTLGKTCDIEISVKDGVLSLTHTMTATAKPITRRLSFKAENLIGAVSGDVYEDPIRIEDKAVGRFAAAEFVNEKNEITILRFEKNTNKEGLIVRIDGSESYCRRLEKK